MASQGVRISAVLASFGLLACTLSVFGFNQLRGPEGTVHRFIMAVGERNAQKVNLLAFGSRGAKTGTASFIDQVLRMGGKYQVVDVRQEKGRARVGVIFHFPNGDQIPWILSLSRVDDRWLVDADGTAGPGPAYMEDR
jgi:hypothetical protein